MSYYRDRKGYTENKKVPPGTKVKVVRNWGKLRKGQIYTVDYAFRWTEEKHKKVYFICLQGLGSKNSFWNRTFEILSPPEEDKEYLELFV